MTGRLSDGGAPQRGPLFESGVRIVEDDCHVIVRRADEASPGAAAAPSLEAATR